MKRKPIYNAVKLASAMIAMGAVSANAIAQEDEIEIEEVIVTGSNIPRAVSDAPQPITVIDSLDIELSGYTNTADILRSSAYNSFGSYAERSGSSFGQIATADLRGIGSQYTAVLINGRRVPGSPFTGASIVDLNTIPLASIESVEILKDGASAIYGTDAVGGVINVRLKDDYEGFEVGGGISAPSFEGGDSENFSVLFGKTFDRGNIVAGAEYFSRDPVFDVDRPYSRTRVDGPTFGDTTGISVGGNTGFTPEFDEAFVLGSCDESLYAGVFDTPFGVSGQGCGFGYADISMQTGVLERKSFFLNGNYEITDSMEAYFDVRFNNNETAGRYAPAVGFFSFPASSPFNTFGRDLDAFHRFVGHGNRDDSAEIDETTIVLGLRGEFGNGIGYDAWVQNFEYDALELGNTYVSRPAIIAAAAEGRYDVLNPLSQDPTHLAAVAETGLQLSRDINTTYRSAGITFNGELFEMSGGTVGWAFGLETADEDYEDRYDEFREAGIVLGSAGNSAAGDRDQWAAFAEVSFPLLDNLELNVAARHDDYSDFGTNFSPQVSVKYSPTDNLTARASWGEGFKAPNLTNLFGAPAESFNDLRDQVRCTAQGIGEADCPNFQVQNFSGGNPDLEAEESENFNIGLIVDVASFSASLDYYNVELTNAVTSLSLASINELEGQNDLPPGVIVNRAPSVDGVPGVIRNITNPFANSALIATDGLDFAANWSIESGIGNWDLNVQYVHVLSFETQNTPNDELTDFIGGSSRGVTGYPDDRVNTQIRLNTGELTFVLNSQYISGFDNPDENGFYESWLSHDVSVNWVDAFGVSGLEFTAGVQNITEEEPIIDSTGEYDRDITLSTYSVFGRIPFLNFKYAFGQ